MKKLVLCLCVMIATLNLAAKTYSVNVKYIQQQSMGTCYTYMLYADTIFGSEASTRSFVFPILIESGAEDVVAGQTYVYPGEMHQTYAYWMLSDYVTHSLYTEATFCKTILPDQRTRIVATASDQRGDSFILTYEEPNGEQEAVSTPEAEHKKIRKVLQNGQIILIQGDKKHTILGTSIY